MSYAIFSGRDKFCQAFRKTFAFKRFIIKTMRGTVCLTRP